MRKLQTLHTRFAESCSLVLRSKLQTPAPLSVTAVEQQYYGEYLQNAGQWKGLYITRMPEVHGICLLEFDSATVIALVARLLGAADEGTIKPRRITKLEQSVFRGIVQLFSDILGACWKSLAPVGISLDKLATDGDLSRLMPSNEILIIVTMTVVVAGQQYAIRVCYPAASLNALLDPEDGIPKPDEELTSSALLGQLQETRVEAIAVLGTTVISARELLGLEEGDILRLQEASTDDISIVVDGAPRFWGCAGVVRGRMGVKLTRITGEE